MPTLWEYPLPCPASTLCYHMQCWGSSLLASFHGGCPGPLVLVFFSTTASAMAWQSSCTVFMVTPTWAVLPAQLRGTIKLNPTSMAFPKGSHSLHDHHPWGKDHSFSNLFFNTFLKHICNQWGTPCVGRWGLVTSSFPQSLSDMDTIVHLIFTWRVILPMLRHYRLFGGQLAGLCKSEGHLEGSTHLQHSFLQQIHIISQVMNCITCVTSFTSMRWGSRGGTVWASAPPQVAFLHFSMGAQKSYPYVISWLILSSLDNLIFTIDTKA